MNLWLRADEGVTLSGSLVASWKDQSSNGYTISQSNNSERPTLDSNSLNSYPIVHFSGSQAFSLPNFMGSSTAGEVLAVVRASSNSPSSNMGLWDLGGQHGVAYPLTNGTIQEAFGSNAVYLLGAPPVSLTQYNIYDISASSTNWMVFFNGHESFAVLNPTVAFNSSPLLGENGFGNLWTGDVVELIAYNHALSMVDRATAGIYLTQKYNLPITIPTAPTNVTAVAISPSQVSLTWQGGTSQTLGVTYTVERSTGGGAYSPVGATTDSYSFIDGSPSAGTAYSYVIVASTYAGSSPDSSAAAVTTPASGTAMPTTGLRFWLRADSGVGTTPAGNVSLWLDQSSNGYPLTQITVANQPQLTSNALNGRPVVHFNGSAGDYLPVPNVMANATGGDEFVVLRSTSATPSGNQQLWEMGGAYATVYPYSSGILADDFGSTVGYQIGVPPANISNFHLYNVSAATGSWTCRMDGGVVYTQSTNTVFFPTSANLGKGQNNTWTGDVAEILIYDHILTAAQRATVSSYLAAKYGLESSPPATASNVAATPLSSTQVLVTWTGDSTVPLGQSFTIYRSANGEASTAVATVTDTYSFIDSTTLPYTSYSYQIQASDLVGTAALSTAATAVTPVSVDPMPVNGVSLWLSADTGLRTDHNGNVIFWMDQSPNGYSISQPTIGSQPSLVTNSLNGRPTVRFMISGQFLPMPNFMSNATSGDEFIVLKSTSAAPAGNQQLWELGGGSSTVYPYSNGILADDFGSTVGYTVGAPLVNISAYHLYNVTATSGAWTSRLDGQTFSDVLGNTVYFPTSANLGKGQFNNWDGNIAEIIVFNRVLSSYERAQVGYYLNAKYNFAQSSTFDTFQDFNNDGLSAITDNSLGINPTNMDIAGDGVPNAVKLLLGLNPLVSDPSLTSDPSDTSPPIITLTAPASAVPLN